MKLGDAPGRSGVAPHIYESAQLSAVPLLGVARWTLRRAPIVGAGGGAAI
jgi:hypothetical protein